MHEDDYLAKCKTKLSGREVTLDRSLLPSSSTLMMTESVSRTPIPFCHGGITHQKTVTFLRLSGATKCRMITSTLHVVYSGLSSQVFGEHSVNHGSLCTGEDVCWVCGHRPLFHQSRMGLAQEWPRSR